MVAHLDAVTSLAVDPYSGTTFSLQEDRDCLDTSVEYGDKNLCTGDYLSHRKKFDESIFDVAFHPSKPS